MRRRLGDCAEVAAKIVLDEQPDTDPGGRLVLAHGYPLGRGSIEGRRYFHAWVESADGTVVIDRSNGLDVVMARDAYYRLGAIIPEHVDRYDREQVIDHILGDKHWGPWDAVVGT